MRIGSIVIRCYEFERMMEFWQNALHYVPKYPASYGWVILTDPNGKGLIFHWIKPQTNEQEKEVVCTWICIQRINKKKWKDWFDWERRVIRGVTSPVMILLCWRILTEIYFALFKNDHVQYEFGLRPAK